MNGDQKNPHDLTINNIMIMSDLKHETGNPESIPSSIASSSSDKIGGLNKSDILQLEINKEIDKLFGPALERTRSGSDIEVTPPLRQKKRQYHSQEVLSPDMSLTETQGLRSSDAGLNIFQINEPKNIEDDKIKQVSVLYDNQRAEIVASVTERLYNRLRRNDKMVSKMESMVDKKIVQPLSELKICSNARQRLVELSQKAIKNKRKIGIPAYTQTKKQATRIKDQEVDIQTDLQPYVYHRQNQDRILQKDVSTETELITARCKDIAVGSINGTLNLTDQSTLTVTKRKTYKNSCTMTDNATTCDCSTQTLVIPPPRRKKRKSVFSKYLKKSESLRSMINDTDKSSSSVINISITPVYPVDSESSSEHSDVSENNCLPTASNTMETKETSNKNDCLNLKQNTAKMGIQIKEQDFSDDDEVSLLPRITIDSNRKPDCKDYEDMLLGRQGYPYNIILSPCKEIDETKRVIQFKDIDITPAECGSAKWLEKKNESLDFYNSESQCNFKPSGSISIDTAELTQIKLDSLRNIPPCIKKNSTSRHIQNNNTRSIVLQEGNRRYVTNGYIKNSLSETELTLSAVKNDNPCSLTNSNLVQFENSLDSKNIIAHLPIDKQIASKPNCTSRKYPRKDRITPTEYLKQLINIRREAVASIYRKRFNNFES